jgi:hypothetical protein
MNLSGHEQVGEFRIFPDEGGWIRATRLDLQVLRPGKIESGARHASSEAPAFERLRHFGVVNDELAGGAAVIDQTEDIADAQLEALLRDIVKDI